MNSTSLLSLYLFIIVTCFFIIGKKIAIKQANELIRIKEIKSLQKKRETKDLLLKLNTLEESLSQTSNIINELNEAKAEASKRLFETEQKYKNIYYNAGIGIARLDSNFNFIDINPKFAQIFGYKNEKEFLSKECEHIRKLFVECALSNTNIIRKECSLLKSDGTEIIVRSTISIIKDDSNNIKYYDICIEDITKEKKAEQLLIDTNNKLEELVAIRTKELIESRNEYMSLYNNAPIGLFKSDANTGKFLVVNEYFSKLLGYSSVEECKQSSFTNHFITKEARDNLIKEIWGNNNTDLKIQTYQCNIISKNNNSLWVLIIEIYNKDLEYFEGVVFDITEKKEAEDKLKYSEDLYKKTINAVSDLIYVTDASDDMIILMSNDANTTELKRAYPELKDIDIIGKPLRYIMPETYDEIAQLNKEVIQNKKPLVLYSQIAKQCNLLLDVFKIPILDNNDNVIMIVTTLRDMTYQKEIETNLTTYNKKLEYELNIKTEELKKAYEILLNEHSILQEEFATLQEQYSKILIDD